MSASTAAEEGPYSWRWCIDAAREHRPALVRANLLGLLAACASVPIPLLMPLLVDEVLLGHPGSMVAGIDALTPGAWHGPVLYIGLTLLVAGVLRLLALLLQVWQTRELTGVAKAVTFRMRSDLLSRLGRVSLAEYETLGSGAVASHFVADVNAIDEFAGATLGRCMVAVLVLAGTAAVLFWMHWQLALFIVLLNPFVVYLTLVMGRRVKDLKRAENGAIEHFQGALTETLEAIQQVRAANRETHFIERLRRSADTVRGHSLRHAWRADAAQRLAFAVFVFGFEIFRGLSMLTVVYSDLTVGQMTAVFGYLWFMMTPLQEVLGMQFAWFGATAAMGRLNRLARLAAEPVHPHLANPFQPGRPVAIDVDGLVFAYAGGAPVLDGLSLHVAAGERVAFVGPSGGGKSTLVQVLLGLYPASAGRIAYGGVPVERIGWDVVREHVACVLQHPALFNDTLRANLCMGRDLPEARLWHALELAQLAPVVAALPDGLDAVIGRDGLRLSGGQRQRLAIARMLLGDPSVVILDEATSALDAGTEAALHDALRSFFAGRTVLIVAHRLSAVRQADRVCVFDGGRVVEDGAHETLIEARGAYERLYGAQR